MRRVETNTRGRTTRDIRRGAYIFRATSSLSPCRRLGPPGGPVGPLHHRFPPCSTISRQNVQPTSSIAAKDTCNMDGVYDLSEALDNCKEFEELFKSIFGKDYRIHSRVEPSENVPPGLLDTRLFPYEDRIQSSSTINHPLEESIQGYAHPYSGHRDPVFPQHMAPASLDYPDRDFNIQAPVNQIHSQYSSPATYVSGPAVPQAPWQDQFLNHPQTYATCLVPTSGPSSTPLQDLNVPIGPQEQETNDPIYSFGLPPFHSILLPPPSYENPFRNELEVKFDASNAPASFPTPSNEQTEERFPHADTSLKPLAHPKKSKGKLSKTAASDSQPAAAEPPQVVPADNQLIVNVVCPFPTCSSRTFAKDDASMHVRIYHTTLCNPKGKRISCPVPDCGRTSKGLTLKSESYARHFTTHFEGDPCPFGCGTKLKRLKPHLADRHKKSCKIFRDGAQAAAQGTQGEAAPAGEPAQAGPSNERLMPGQWPQDRPTVSNSRTRAAATAETQAVAGPHAGMHVFQAGPQPLPSAPAPRRGRPKANTSRPGPSEASTSQAGSSYASPSNSTPAYGIDPEQVVSAFARELPEEYAWVAPHELQPYPEQADHDSHPGPAFAGAAQLPPAGALSYEPYCYSAPPGFDALAMPPSGGSGLPAILEERFGPLESPTLGPRVPDLFDIAPFMVDGAYQEDPSRYKDKSSARHLPTFPPTPSAGAWTSTESYTQLGFRRSARILSRSNSAAEAATAPSGMADGTARSSEPAAVQTAGERRRKRQRGDHAEAPSGKKERRG